MRKKEFFHYSHTVVGDEAVEEFLEKLLGELGKAGLLDSAVGL
jgi:hypothetical protein